VSDDLVTVFETGDPGLVALAKSLLDSAGIEFATKGDALQDLFGVGRFPGGTNLVTGPVVFQVGPDDAEEAKSILRDLRIE
jgi:putative signal transducing protein